MAIIGFEITHPEAPNNISIARLELPDDAPQRFLEVSYSTDESVFDWHNGLSNKVKAVCPVGRTACGALTGSTTINGQLREVSIRCDNFDCPIAAFQVEKMSDEPQL